MKHIYINFIGVLIIIVCLFVKRQEGFQNNQKSTGVIMNLRYGLGNQLFIYAAALSLKQQYNVPVYLLPVDNSRKLKRNTHSKRDYRTLFKGVDPIEKEDPRVKNARKFNFSNVEQLYDFNDFDKIPFDDEKDIYIEDHLYQNYNIIKNVIPEVTQIITKELQEEYGDIGVNDPDSTAFIHVRRGDFVTAYSGTLNVTSHTFFDNALDILNSVSKVQTIYITSDDMEWCKDHKWNTSNKIIFFDESDELRTLYMMSLCWAGAIIPNSTFSLWGALLGAHHHNGRIIYAYSSGKFLDTLPENWTKMDI